MRGVQQRHTRRGREMESEKAVVEREEGVKTQKKDRASGGDMYR